MLILSVAGAIKKTDSPYKVYLGAMLLGALVLLVVVVRNTEILGAPMMGAEYFPSYVAARVIDVGDFLSRIEITIAMNFILAGIVKISMCLIAAAKGAARLFAVSDYRRIVMPVGVADGGAVRHRLQRHDGDVRLSAHIPVLRAAVSDRDSAYCLDRRGGEDQEAETAGGPSGGSVARCFI